MALPAPVIEVDLGAGVRAGFTTRAAGSLRLAAPGAGSAAHQAHQVDQADPDGRAVAEDEVARASWARAGRWAGGPLVFATQVHGRDVVVVDGRSPAGPAGTGVDVVAGSVGRYDGLVSVDGAAIAVVVADCVPVLLADARAGVVGAVHAGRNGLAAGVVQAAVAVMVARGAAPGRIRAAIGPAICGACYEVPADLRAAVAARLPATWAQTSWGTPSLDLPAGVHAVLAASGVRDVVRLDVCTFTDDRFFSHRRSVRDGAAEARFAAVIRATAPLSGVSGDRTPVGPC